VGTIAVVFLTSMASRMTEGSIAVFTLAFNLQGVPLAIVGMSYSLAAFPALSRMFTRNDIGGFIEEIKSSLGHIIFWSWPIIILFVVLRAQIVRVILGSSSRFTWSDTKLTAAIFAIMALSVLGQAVVLLMTRAFYAAKNTYIPLIINSFTAIMTIIISVIFTDIYNISPGFKTWILHIMRVDGTPGAEVLMLAIGFTLSLILDGILLWYVFTRKFKSDYSSLRKTFIQSLGASMVMGVTAYFCLNIFDKVFNLETVIGVFLQGFLSGIVGIVLGILILKLLGNKEIKEIWNTLHQKFWKSKVDIAGPDVLQ
jgi:putative peptidoglycan lipid II flippase